MTTHAVAAGPRLELLAAALPRVGVQALARREGPSRVLREQRPPRPELARDRQRTPPASPRRPAASLQDPHHPPQRRRHDQAARRLRRPAAAPPRRCSCPATARTAAAGCVSSQIGCAMGCDFCASTTAGLERNLEAGEIVEQFLHLKRAAADDGRRLTSLVFMGMGEPMHNLDNVARRHPPDRRPGPRRPRLAAGDRLHRRRRPRHRPPRRGRPERPPRPLAARPRRRHAQPARPRQPPLPRRRDHRRRQAVPRDARAGS